MKNLWFVALFILSIVLMGCSETGKDKEEEGLVEETGAKIPGKTEKQKQQTGITKADAAFQEKFQNREIILITNSDQPEPFKFEGSKITAMKLPDGNLHQVREDKDRTFINIPGKGEMGIIILNDKFYLFDDDDQAYEVKFINKQLYAEKTQLTDVLISRK